MPSKYVTEKRYYQDMKRMRDQMVDMFLITAQCLDASPDQSAVEEIRAAFDHILQKQSGGSLPKKPTRPTTHDYQSFCHHLAQVMIERSHHGLDNLSELVEEAQQRHTLDPEREEVPNSTAMQLASGLREGFKVFKDVLGPPAPKPPSLFDE